MMMTTTILLFSNVNPFEQHLFLQEQGSRDAARGEFRELLIPVEGIDSTVSIGKEGQCLFPAVPGPTRSFYCRPDLSSSCIIVGNGYTVGLYRWYVDAYRPVTRMMVGKLYR